MFRDGAKKHSVKLNGTQLDQLYLERSWKAGDKIELILDMPPEWIYSNLRVTGNAGRVAIMRGPVVYALEEIDQKYPVRELILNTSEPLTLDPCPEGFPADSVAIKGKAWRESFKDSENLYTTGKPELSETSFQAVPYAFWQNREENNMAVWIRRK